MQARSGGRYIADKNGDLRPDPKDQPTRPIPAEGEPGYAESAATPNAPEQAADAAPESSPEPEPAKPAKTAKES
ncbi:MAG: hypothetical protein DI566_13515 [Microbacterium sp.]|nr:MAG: hypothetical protein DI566_13515 [Microbacterium sp.]